MIASKYQEFKVLELRIQEELEKLDALKSDQGVAAASAIEAEFKELIADVGCADVIAMVVAKYGVPATAQALAPFIAKEDGAKGGAGGGTKKPRKRKTWTHPETGESFTGGKAAGPVPEWIKEHGKEVVDTWVVDAE